MVSSVLIRGLSVRPIRTPTFPPEPRSTNRLSSAGSNDTIPSPGRPKADWVSSAAPSPKYHDGILRLGVDEVGDSGPAMIVPGGGSAVVPWVGLLDTVAPP